MPSPRGLLKKNDFALRARSLFLRRPRGSGIILHLLPSPRDTLELLGQMKRAGTRNIFFFTWPNIVGSWSAYDCRVMDALGELVSAREARVTPGCRL